MPDTEVVQKDRLASPRCTHCRSNRCRKLAAVSPAKASCPLLEIPNFTKAWALAKQDVDLYEEHPTGPFLEVMVGIGGRMA
jgi:hypothetical protein